MFDGVLSRFPMRKPIDPRPAPLDVRAVIPMLRAQTTDAAVRFLAIVVGDSAITAARWIEINWGCDGDLRDPQHPARAAAMDPSSPTWKLAEAQDALAAACRRYRVATGYNGLSLAREAIAARFGPTIAEHALKPLDAATTAAALLEVSSAASLPELSSAELQTAIDELLADEDPEPPPEPTPEQWQAGRSAIAEWVLADDGLEDVSARLAELLTVSRTEGATASDLLTSIEAVGGAVGEALQKGFDSEVMQSLLDYWSTGNGAPRITLTIDKSSTTPRIEEN